MEKGDLAQQRGKSSHSSAALKSSHNVSSLKRKTKRSNVEKVVIAQQL